MKTGFRFPTHLEAKETLLVNVSRETPSLCTSLASLYLDKTFRKELIHSSGTTIFKIVAKGTPSDHWSGGQQELGLKIHRTVHICIL